MKMVEENSTPKRKVNPALLLKTAQAQEKARPVVETTNFGARTRSDWRAREAAAKKVAPPTAEPTVKTPAAATPLAKAPLVKPPVSSPSPTVASTDRVVNPNPMLVDDAASAEEDLLVRRAKLSPSRRKPVSGAPTAEDDTLGVAAADSTVSKRKVNSRFSFDDENSNDDEVEAEVPPATPSRVVRPNFLTPNERAASSTGVAFVRKADAKPRPHYDTKTGDNIEVSEWDDNTDTDTSLGLGAEVDNGYIEPQFARGFHLTERDIIIMKFLARYRYAYTDQLARLVDTMPRAIITRMSTLEKRGFVRKQPITERQYLWMTRKAGNMLADISFGEIKKGTVSYATIAHTIGLANLGVELEREAGGKDILGERADPDDLPFENRFKLGLWGNPEGKTFGEMTVTEREIRQGQMRWRGGRPTSEMRELVEFAAANREEAPELLEGNEGLFVVYANGGEHIPDLVVAKERTAAEENKPMHLAIELELTGKPAPQWKRILRWYRDSGIMYDKVIYFTHKRSIATALRRADEEVGLGDRLMIRKYIPTSGNRMPFWG